MSCGEAGQRNGLPCPDVSFNQFAWLKIVPTAELCFPTSVKVPAAVWTPCYWYRAPNPFTSKHITIGNTSDEATFSYESPSSIQGLSELFKSDDNTGKTTVVCTAIDLLTDHPNSYSVGFRYAVTISLLNDSDQDYSGSMEVLDNTPESRSWVLQAADNLSIFPQSLDEKGHPFTLTWNDDNVSE